MFACITCNSVGPYHNRRIDNTTIHSDDNITITKEFYTQMIHDLVLWASIIDLVKFQIDRRINGFKVIDLNGYLKV
ncbi:hypothetical protein BLOT_012122 [Blomia tropicalis]|nr:hypothetical protein BLOT_012122 [Blomia tropicalis]